MVRRLAGILLREVAGPPPLKVYGRWVLGPAVRSAHGCSSATPGGWGRFVPEADAHKSTARNQKAPGCR